MPLSDLLVLFAIFALTAASAILLRRQGIRGRDLLVATWLCFYGVVLIAMMTAHSGEILYRTVAARAALPPGVSSYNFRLYSLLLLGLLLIGAGAMCLRVAPGVGRGSIEGRRTSVRTSVFVLAIVAPLIPLQRVFGILLTVLSMVSLLVLRRRSHIEGSRKGYPGLLALLPFLIWSCQADDPTANGGMTEPGVLASGYWITDGIAVIGEGEFLFADRGGALYHYVRGGVTKVQGLPASRISGIYGGLLDVSLHPSFPNSRLVYIAYNDASFDLAVARFELRDDRAESLSVIYESDEFSIGSRIEWEDPSHFFLSFGVGGDPYPDPGPQDLTADVGKIHRLTADGQIPRDNPILPGALKPSTIWSYGHRNPQGLYYDASERTLYATEHGPLGGDELNIVLAGANYGWPLFSYGLNYNGTRVSDMSEGAARGVSILPAKFWGPEFRVAPSGLLFVEGSQFTSWNGAFLFGALKPQHLLRYDPATDATEIVLRNVGRVRDIAQLPSGKLLIAVDAGSPNPSDRGRIIELSPDSYLR